MLRGTGQGVLPYLNEPVSASSAANYPGTAFHRAHTRTSSFHCAASCRGKENRSCCCSGWIEVRPTPTWGFAAILPAGDRRKGDGGHGRWRWALMETCPGPLTAQSTPFPMDPCQRSIYSWSCPGVRRTGHLLMLHSLVRMPKNKKQQQKSDPVSE